MTRDNELVSVSNTAANTPAEDAERQHLEAVQHRLQQALTDADAHLNRYAQEIQEVFTSASCVTLNTSYRSSYEITLFAQRICPNPDLVAIKRHGEPPQIAKCRTKKDETARIAELAKAFDESGHNTLGIICKTQKQARRLADALNDSGVHTHLVQEQSQTFFTGIIVCTSHMAKGLEFDEVIVPEASATTYHTPMDRNLLYVACTRAMHRLTLTHTGAVSPFLQPPPSGLRTPVKMSAAGSDQVVQTESANQRMPPKL